MCQACKTQPAQLLCKCSDIYLCEQCIGSHIMQVFNVKHKPTKISSFDTIELETYEFSPEIEKAIYSKLSNEILELEEFRKLALQKISELLQEAEKQLLETSEKVMHSISDVVEIAQNDISNALSLLSYRGTCSNYILEVFKKCKQADEVREIDVVHKSLEYNAFNIAEVINSSLLFNIQITDQPLPPSPCKTDQLLQKLKLYTVKPSMPEPLRIDKNDEDEEALFIPSRRTITSIELELINKPFNYDRVSRTFSKTSFDKTCQVLPPCIYHFVQNSNRIVWYNIETAKWEQLAAPNHIFFKDSAWCLCEGGKLMNTGGYEFQAKDQTFLINLHLKTEEKCPNMPTKRYKHAQVSLGNSVYVIGGLGCKRTLKSVEIFNLETWKWKKAGNMSCGREYPAACSHDGKIYIIGGVSNQSVEVFSPLAKKFILLNIKISSPGRSCVFSYDDYIIILRGDTLTKFITKSLTTIEKSKVMHCDWMMQGDPYITKDTIYFYFMEELFALDLVSNLIRLIGQIS